MDAFIETRRQLIVILSLFLELRINLQQHLRI
ncbi:hypothetical protein BpOF4_20024 (plasmid) [Alkalihalophilus pseudofirmus OF4]|uniref:Uncharacterized protein n=1 Tax=Alkalihalophilus pseudofirmus (strain ATCC BAA-2126 / JCM 17055 / OF4) TaxID=398511 RepID=D3G0X8_ALKPO|nr:hypothetical protein BpOF4_20024 [Alkalihalophilus pseudofirmus OF4]